MRIGNIILEITYDYSQLFAIFALDINRKSLG